MSGFGGSGRGLKSFRGFARSRAKKKRPVMADGRLVNVQFELITAPHSGLVVIQGGAGSGKTTIGLHRLAYLAFQDSKRFRADKMLVIVFNDALVRYISRVLPALGVSDMPVQTFQRWAEQQGLPRRVEVKMWWPNP